MAESIAVKESTHWYALDGTPVYTVKAKAGHDRPTTLADARKLNLAPGCTTIIAQAAKPGLERWKQEQVLLAALTLPRKEGQSEAEWIEAVFADSKEQAKRAAEKGTAIHACLEWAFQKKLYPSEFRLHVEAAAKKVEEEFHPRAWLAEKSFFSHFGYGCKIDLCGLERDGAVIDFKTKEFSEGDGKKLAWEEHAMQLAANRVAAGIPNAICANLFVSTSAPGLVQLHIWPEEDLQRGWAMFKALLDYWYARTGLKR